jgi:hypothetical protein
MPQKAELPTTLGVLRDAGRSGRPAVNSDGQIARSVTEHLYGRAISIDSSIV